ncbi:MAG: OmpH family outer membrane protein [Planctomycetes bacterium]|nr:OmpH family outer membrane protein [Planctomycetota bacterium]
MRTLLLSTLVSVAFASIATPTVAQQSTGAGPSANASRYGIAVVDVSYIFKEFQQFRTAMDGMKKEMEAAEGQLKAERDAVQAKEEQRKQYKPGSPEDKQLDEEIARAKADFNLKAGRIRKDFLEREAKVYYQTYMQVSNAVQHYAQQHNIGLVIRFNGDPVDPNRRESVLQAINKPVVAQNNIDITPDVLALLNRGGTETDAAPASAARAGATQRR